MTTRAFEDQMNRADDQARSRQMLDEMAQRNKNGGQTDVERRRSELINDIENKIMKVPPLSRVARVLSRLSLSELERLGREAF